MRRRRPVPSASGRGAPARAGRADGDAFGVGAPRSFGYGNAEVGAAVDAFWLEGPLAISPVGQVEFLERLTGGRLPVSARSVEILRRVMPGRPVGRAVLRARTGTYVGENASHGWLVGWVEDGGEVTAHFALLVLGDGERAPDRELRWELAEELLSEAGALPP